MRLLLTDFRRSVRYADNMSGRTPQHPPVATLYNLLDLSQVPVAMPPGVDPQMAKHVIEYLKQNPEAAQQSYLEAQRILHTPGMAESMLNSQTQTAADPAYQERLAAMQEDPDLKNVFDDIKANGAGAMEKYWNDSELMTKISEKMGGIKLQSSRPSKGAGMQKVSLLNDQVASCISGKARHDIYLSILLCNFHVSL